MYFNTETFDLYQLSKSGQSLIGNISGEDGEDEQAIIDNQNAQLKTILNAMVETFRKVLINKYVKQLLNSDFCHSFCFNNKTQKITSKYFVN